MNLMTSLRWLLTAAGLLVLPAIAAAGSMTLIGAGSSGAGSVTNFYVSNSGSDSNNGLTTSTPWQHVSKVNSSTFSTCSTINFNGGQTFTDALVVPSSGTSSCPLTFQSYGTGVATIAPSAANTSGIAAVNKQYLTIQNLIVVGQSQTTDLADGVHIENSQAGNTKLQNISLINLNVSLFNQNGVDVLGSAGTSGFNNVVISNVTAHDNTGGPSSIGTSGIVVRSPVAGYGSGITSPSHTNVTISNCLAYNNIGDTGQTNWTGSGIHIAQTSGGIIQNSVAHDNGSVGTGSVGIWAGDSTNITIQFNEVYNQSSSNTSDGDGFDLDGGVTNSVVQYNYSHENKGAGVLLYAYNDGQVTTWNNNTVRYHISQNDGVSGGGGTGSLGGISVQQDATMTNVFVYNNTIYSNVGRVFTVRNSMTGNVANNIFYATGTNNIVLTSGATALNFTGNDYFSTGTFSINWNTTNYSTFAAWQTATSQEKISGVNVGLTSNPSLQGSGSGGTIGGYAPPAPTAYDLLTGSPMIGTGLNLSTQFSINPGTKDYYGNAIPEGSGTGYPVGAYAGAGSSFTTFNPADKSTVATLTNGNLTVNATSTGSNNAARTVLPIASGAKKYFEVTLTHFAAADDLSIGIVDSSFNLNAGGGNQILYWVNDGIYNSATLLASLGTAVSGTSILRIAVDNTVNKKVYFSLDGGNWNGSGTANPATNVGGLALTDLSAFANVYGFGSSFIIGDNLTANFGATAFTYSIPTGYSGL